MNELIKTLDLYFGKEAPQLPKSAKEWIVKYSPYLSIFGVVVMAVIVLGGLGMYSSLGMFMGRFYYYRAPGISLAVLIALVSTVLYIIAIPGLSKRNSSGWNFMFYAAIVSAIGQLLSYDILGAIVSLLIGFYILFQIKGYYFGELKISEPATSVPASPTAPVVENKETPSEK